MIYELLAEGKENARTAREITIIEIFKTRQALVRVLRRISEEGGRA